MVNYLCLTRIVYESANTRRMLPVVAMWLWSFDKSTFIWDLWAHGPIIIASAVSFPVMVLHIPMLPVFVSSIAIGFPVWVSLFSVGLIVSFSGLLLWEFSRCVGVVRCVKRNLARLACTRSAFVHLLCRKFRNTILAALPTFFFLVWATYAVEMMVMFWGGAAWEDSVDFYHAFTDRTDAAYFTQDYKFRELVAFWMSFI